jgi:NAD(P)-dependent dehydrogenase (short-subunit alcohol dehydrogenase family)
VNDFKDKVVIVTGASSGIGKATVQLFAQHQATVVIADINERDGQKVATEISQANGSATFCPCDVAKPEQVESLVKFAVDTYGGLNVIVNNAGIVGEVAPIADLSIEGWQKVVDVNLNGVFYGIKYAVPAILSSGGGAIVNLASVLGQVSVPNVSGYITSKHAVVGLTKTAAQEYSAQGIRVNAVGPGYIDTPLLSDDDEQWEERVSLHPIGRRGVASDVAELIVWLASDKASFCTGGFYPVDGGYLTH